MDSMVAVNSFFRPDSCTTSKVAVGAVAGAIPANTSATVTEVPTAIQTKKTHAAAHKTLKMESASTVLPRSFRTGALKLCPSKKPTIARAICVSVGNHALAVSSSKIPNTAGPMTTPDSNSTLTRGSGVERPTTSAANPTKKMAPKVSSATVTSLGMYR